MAPRSTIRKAFSKAPAIAPGIPKSETPRTSSVQSFALTFGARERRPWRMRGSWASRLPQNQRALYRPSKRFTRRSDGLNDEPRQSTSRFQLCWVLDELSLFCCESKDEDDDKECVCRNG